MEKIHEEVDQHYWLGRCVTPFYEVELLGEDVIVQSNADALLIDRLLEESYICSIITDKKLSRGSD